MPKETSNGWPTPKVSDTSAGRQITDGTQGNFLRVNDKGDKYGANLSDVVLKSPTPIKSDHKRNGPNSKQQNLASTVTKQVFPTPRVSGEESYETVSKRKGHEAAIQHNLLAAVQFSPTTTAQDYGGSTRSDFSPKLSEVAKMYPTPAAQDGKNSTLPVSLRNRDSIPGQLLKDGVQPGAQLNPDWVELLMMWPMCWTSLEPQNINLQDWIANYRLEAHQTTEWEQGIPRVATDIPNRTKRIEAIGNGQVPRCYAAAYVILSAALAMAGKTKEQLSIRA